MQTMAPPEHIPAERFERIDERFDDVGRRFDEVDRKFEQVNQRITEGKQETAHRFDRVERDISELKAGLASVQASLNRGWIGLALGFLTLVGTILAKGG
jgi:tetrahydromethanopterin S-methyltransferase subunit G